MADFKVLLKIVALVSVTNAYPTENSYYLLPSSLYSRQHYKSSANQPPSYVAVNPIVYANQVDNLQPTYRYTDAEISQQENVINPLSNSLILVNEQPINERSSDDAVSESIHNFGPRSATNADVDAASAAAGALGKIPTLHSAENSNKATSGPANSQNFMKLMKLIDSHQPSDTSATTDPTMGLDSRLEPINYSQTTDSGVVLDSMPTMSRRIPISTLLSFSSTPYNNRAYSSPIMYDQPSEHIISYDHLESGAGIRYPSYHSPTYSSMTHTSPTNGPAITSAVPLIYSLRIYSPYFSSNQFPANHLSLIQEANNLPKSEIYRITSKPVSSAEPILSHAKILSNSTNTNNSTTATILSSNATTSSINTSKLSTNTTNSSTNIAKQSSAEITNSPSLSALSRFETGSRKFDSVASGGDIWQTNRIPAVIVEPINRPAGKSAIYDSGRMSQRDLNANETLSKIFATWKKQILQNMKKDFVL